MYRATTSESYPVLEIARSQKAQHNTVRIAVWEAEGDAQQMYPDGLWRDIVRREGVTHLDGGGCQRAMAAYLTLVLEVIFV